MSGTRRFVVAVLATLMLLAGAALPAAAQEQDGLVNVAIGDVTILEDIRVNAAANIVANLCAQDVDVVLGILSNIDQTGTGQYSCEQEATGRNIIVTDN